MICGYAIVSIIVVCNFYKCCFQSKGNEVVDALQYVCSNDVDVTVGSIIHTGMQNKHGGYENDCSLARLAENQWVIRENRISLKYKQSIMCILCI